MEIFIVEVDQVSKGEILDCDTKAYSTEEKAKRALKEFVDDEKTFCKRDGWKIESDDDDYFLAYSEGDYLSNHTEAAVRLLEVI